MRVGIDWRPAYAERGGIPVYVRHLVAALAETFPADDWRLYGHRLRDRAAIASGRVRPPARAARLYSSPIPTRAAEALARFGVGADRLVGGCDVFHLTDYAWLRPTRAPLVATVHDVLFEELPRCYTPRMRRGLRHVTRRLVRHAARILVPSVRTKIGLVERFRADPDRVDVVPLAPRAFPSAPPAGSFSRYALAVGTLEPRKNLLRLVDAHRIALARGSNVDLVVVGGRGWLDDSTLEAVRSSPRVRWEGAVDDERLLSLYRGALFLAYPSLGEGYGLPVAEALSLGVPVLTSAGTQCSDLAGDAALSVDPYDVEEMASEFGRLASDDALRRSLVGRGLARASAWSWTRTAEGTRETYASAAAT